MATKDGCLSVKDKQSVFGGDTSNEQYSNLNLNQNHQSEAKQILRSKSVTRDNRKVQSYGKTI